MFLNCPAQTLDVSFRVKHGEGHYLVYASTGSMKCYECGDVGHKRTACPHRQAEGRPEPGPSGPAEERTFFFLGELFPFVFLSMVHTTRQRKECTHSYKFHVRSGQISYLENKEKSCEGCRVRGRGYDADRAAGSSAQGGV